PVAPRLRRLRAGKLEFRSLAADQCCHGENQHLSVMRDATRCQQNLRVTEFEHQGPSYFVIALGLNGARTGRQFKSDKICSQLGSSPCSSSYSCSCAQSRLLRLRLTLRPSPSRTLAPNPAPNPTPARARSGFLPEFVSVEHQNPADFAALPTGLRSAD